MSEVSAEEAGQSESMEDILQSIKRIIEDDADTDAKSDIPAGNKADVLELTQVVGDDGVVTSVEPMVPMPAPVKEEAMPDPVPLPAKDIFESIDTIVAKEKSVEKPIEKPIERLETKPVDVPVAELPDLIPVERPMAAPAVKPIVMEEGLVSDKAAQAAAAALKPIVEGAHKSTPLPHIPSPGMRNGTTVEDLILESLKPMLKAWLDEHLPTIVQKIVEKEVKRIVTFHQD